MYLSMPGPGALAEPFAFISATYITKLAPLAREIKCAVKEFFLQVCAQRAQLTTIKLKKQIAYHPGMPAKTLLSGVINAWSASYALRVYPGRSAANHSERWHSRFVELVDTKPPTRTPEINSLTSG